MFNNKAATYETVDNAEARKNGLESQFVGSAEFVLYPPFPTTSALAEP